MTCEEATAMKRSTRTVLKKEIQLKQRAKSSMECVTLAHFLLSQLRTDGNQPLTPLVHMIMVKAYPFLLVHPRLDSIQHLIKRSHPVVNQYQSFKLQHHFTSLTSVSNRSTSEKQQKSHSWSSKECRSSQSPKA